MKEIVIELGLSYLKKLLESPKSKKVNKFLRKEKTANTIEDIYNLYQVFLHS